MVLVFDLDDTLFEELSFVRGGFRAVSEYLAFRYRLDQVTLNLDLLSELSHGRGNIFDRVLRRYSIFSKSLVARLISVYRYHAPNIRLYPDAKRMFERFSGFPVYIVTDGNKLVQERKISALGVEKLIKKAYITHRYGLKNAKPSPFCFLKITDRENTDPKNVFYIGDNPQKDFVGIKPFGFKTIRILRGNYARFYADEKHKAHVNLNSLDNLNLSLLKMKSLYE